MRPDLAPSEPNAALLRALFDELIEIPAPERAAWLAARVPDIALQSRLLDLLAADDDDGLLDTPAAQVAARLAPDDAPAEGLIGREIGGFRLLRTLGQGGMAAVFLGERTGTDFVQRAAIKLLRRGLYSKLEQRLFQRERQMLAALDHPNIARLIDGGLTTQGVPYLVMEFVDGAPITEHAATRSLDARARLKLFLAVCRAVEAAHRSLIVHRDIKPSNILVSNEGLVKLLDFGIAKLIEEESDDATGTIGVFTPGYAAPEQIEGGAITTATDVYSLGVLLHELLLGMRPEGSPTRRPSSRVGEIADDAKMSLPTARLRKLLRGDLDNIVLKALAEEPALRYASAGAFADDIERHLDGRPVAAHPPSRLYRTRKFVQRHRGGVALTTLFVLGILASLGLALWQANVARHERDRASSVLDFLLHVFAAAAPGVADANAPTLRDVVADGQAALANDARLDADARIEIATRLVDVQREIGDLAAARKQAEALLDQATRRYGPSAVPTLVVARALAEVDIDSGDQSAVIATVGRFVDRESSPHTPQTARLLALQAEAQVRMSHFKEALADAGMATDWCAQARCAGQEEIDVAETLAEVYEDAGKFDEAEATYRRALALKRAQFGDEHAFVAGSLLGISSSEMKAGRYAEAEATAREGIAIAEKVYVRPHNRLAGHYQNLGILYFKQERFDDAIRAWQRTLELQNAVLPDGHRDLEATLNNLGAAQLATEHYADAVPLLRRAAASARRRGEAGEADYAVTARSLANALAYAGAFDEAKRTIEESITLRTRMFGANDARTLASRSSLVAMLLGHGTSSEALIECDAILQGYTDAKSTDRDAVAQIEMYKAEALFALARHDEGMALLRTALSELSEKPFALRVRARAQLDLAENTPPADAQRASNIALASQTIARLNFKPPSMSARLAALRPD